MNNLPILYSFRRCPYAIRARLAISASQEKIIHREIELQKKPASMLRASLKGTVPVLVLPNGIVIDESWDIMLWAVERHDPLGWLTEVKNHWGYTLNIVKINDTKFKNHLDRYKYPNRFIISSSNQDRDAGSVILSKYNQYLSSKDFFAGENFGLLDSAIAPFVRQYANTDRTWFDAQNWTYLKSWLQNFESSDLFSKAMVKHLIWQEDQE